ncbi:MAG TPA: pentapeptide repeat-containing protein, partial [Pyrinomonadaceae bacterium]
MATSPTSQNTSVSEFVCECADLFRSACTAEPFYKERNGKRYCVLHYPSVQKISDFQDTFKRKLHRKDFDFRGVWFPSNPEFFEFEFSEKADFIGATFSVHAEFYRATFRAGAYFSEATFVDGANFTQTAFNAGANFGWAIFRGETAFDYAEFSGEVDFTEASFNAAVVFFGATFKDHVRFAGGVKKHPTFVISLDLQFARIEVPDHFSFHTLTARPPWFINVDARKFDFSNVDWYWRTTKEEIRTLQQNDISSPHRLLAIACRQLAVNAEENHRYEEASKFRYMAMDARRLEHWRGFDFRRLSWWYWLASGYGERVWQAGVVLVCILLFCAALFTRVGFTRWEPRVTNQSEAATAQRDEVGAPFKFTKALT